MHSTLQSITCLFTLILLLAATSTAQTVISGTVTDQSFGQEVLGARITVKGTDIFTETDELGKFKITTANAFPITLVIDAFGFEPTDYIVKSVKQKVRIEIGDNTTLLDGVEIQKINISSKQKESALTVESMSLMAIKECPAADFYEGLGALKGVDLTSASIGFKVINTRGFNSTSPVRSLQIIDGVDNQAPGLNFSLGNFLGSSELDLKKVDLIVGASSSFYGPNAFNGVISMETKDPFQFQGLSVQAKMAERNLVETAIRYAKAFQNKLGEDKFGFKINLSYLKADDWVADNLDAVYESNSTNSNLGGHDAINRYGDERALTESSQYADLNRPGMGVIYRTGYEEKDIVDYDTENLKTALAMHYKFSENTQLIASSSFGTGTTVYQGDNRYSLKDILFFQNRLELKGNKGFLRAYATHEDAGNSYDAVFTSLLLQDRSKSDSRWAVDYGYYWTQVYAPKVRALPGFPSPQIIGGEFFYDYDLANSIMAQYSDSLAQWHSQARFLADLGLSPPGGIVFDNNMDRLVPGTPEFEAALNDVTSKTSFLEGGSKFYDKSALYHVHGERLFYIDSINHPDFKITIGGNYRLYTPKSKGSIFKDTNSVITNREGGAYVGIEKKYVDDRLKFNATIRADKNENFDLVYSPSASAVYNIDENSIVRISFASATRNPTLQDQYLYYNTGRAILLGNTNGFDSLITIPSALDFNSSQNQDDLDYFNVAPIRTEKVKTVEIGYRNMIKNTVYVDASYYYSFYKDFIGYNIAIDSDISSITNQFNWSTFQVYRIATNATDIVTTQGASIGLNYYTKKFLTFRANYSWNKLDKQGSEDPIIPAFNTPEHKYNLGMGGTNMNGKFKFSKKEGAKEFSFKNIGFNINYKWIQSFLYEGSPQFTGIIPSYSLLDAQINKYIPKFKSTFKIGASNLLNNKQFQVYGGPRVGRMIYFSIRVDLDKQ